MLRVSEQYAGTDTGLQRRANEDSMLSRSPLFVVADGMGGAQAGEVASRLAVEAFHEGLGDVSRAEAELAEHALLANARIHELSQTNPEHAGMGTTLTAVFVGEREIAIAHVGDSRAYCLRDGELLRLTDDHSLVDELIRQGKLTPEEAEDHPQRSIITRALGPEPHVEVDTRSYPARAGDVYLLCSDGLTSMIGEGLLAEILLAHSRLHDAGEALIAEANRAGGRDNITVILLRLEEIDATAGEMGEEHTTLTGVPAVGFELHDAPERSGSDLRAAPGPTAELPPPRAQRAPRPASVARVPARRRSRLRRARPGLIALTVLGLLLAGAYVASQSVYFIGTNGRGLVTLYRGVPYQLPGSIKLYGKSFVSGVSASTLSPERRSTLLDHSLRSEASASALVRSLELGQLDGG